MGLDPLDDLPGVQAMKKVQEHDLDLFKAVGRQMLSAPEESQRPAPGRPAKRKQQTQDPNTFNSYSDDGMVELAGMCFSLQL